MKYLVMECHNSYSIVLDDKGRFLKVANMNYQIGQTVDDVFEMIEPETNIVAFPEKKKENKIFGKSFGILALAASLIFIFTSLFNMNNATIGSIYMKINPEVRLDINRKDIVVGAIGINEDGKDLLEGYSYTDKHMDKVVDELVELAIDKGYLFDQGKISIKIDATDQEWVTKTGGHLDTHLKQLLSEDVVIKINYGDTDYDDDDDEPKKEETKTNSNTQITIPVKNNDPVKNDDMTDYDDSSYDNTTTPSKPTQSPINNSQQDDSAYDTDDTNDDSGYDTNDDSGYGGSVVPTKPTPTPTSTTTNDDSGYDDSAYDDDSDDSDSDSEYD